MADEWKQQMFDSAHRQHLQLAAGSARQISTLASDIAQRLEDGKVALAAGYAPSVLAQAAQFTQALAALAALEQVRSAIEQES